MSSDWNLSVVPKQKNERIRILGRVLVAVALGVGVSIFFGVTVWAGAYSNAEIRAVETREEQEVGRLREQEITQLRITLGRRLPSNRRADLYFRMAELYLEAYRQEFFLEGRAHERRIENGKIDHRIDRSRSKPYARKGIEASEEIIRLGIPVQEMDKVYYFLGFNYGELSDAKKSERYFSQLASRFPGSPLAAEAMRELGDRAFDNKSYRKALTYYERASHGDKTSPSYPRILHRLAWCYYRTKQFDRSIETLKTAISRAVSGGEKFLSLREEALRDMAVFMTERGKVDEALEYFSKVAGDEDYYPKSLEKLGKEYERQVRVDDAIRVYEALVRARPKDEASFRVIVKLVDLELRRGRHTKALERIKAASLPDSDEEETKVSVQNLKAMVRRTATEKHERARKTDIPKQIRQELLKISEAYYSAYLNKFLSEEDPRSETPEIEMYLAEVKRKLGKSEEASLLYRRVLESQDKRYAKEAGALWVSSLSDALKRMDASNKSRHSEPYEIEREFVEAADHLQEIIPGTREAREALLRSAQLLAAYSKTRPEAVERSRKLLRENADSPQAITAARLWLQILNDQVPTLEKADEEAYFDKKEQALAAIKEIKSNPELMNFDQKQGKGELAKTVSDFERRLQVGTIAVFEKGKDHARAAVEYERFAKATKDRKLVEKAFANAVAAFRKAGDAEAVLRVTEEWASRYPDSAEATQSLRFIATSHLIEGEVLEAARRFKGIGFKHSDQAAAETAIWLFDAAGSSPEANETREAFLIHFKTSPSVPRVELALARSREQASKDSKAAEIYERCLGRDSNFRAECGARLGDLYFRAKNIDAARQAYRRTAALKSASPFVGYAKFKLAHMALRETKFLKLEPPQAQLSKALEERTRYAAKLAQVYADTVAFGGPWAIAALVKQAEWVLSFADEVDQIPVEDLAFKKGLGQVSAQLRDKALQTLRTATKNAVRSETLAPVIPEAIDQLADFGAAARAQGRNGGFRLAGLASDGGEEGHDSALSRVRKRLNEEGKDAAAWTDYGNLLWGEGRSELALIIYDQALSLNPRSSHALNNKAVVILMSQRKNQEDWVSAAEANGLLMQAAKKDPFFTVGLANRGLLLNYFRLFERAKPLWDQVLAKSSQADFEDGLAVSLQGLGSPSEAERHFEKAEQAGASSGRFVSLYHAAARAVQKGNAGASECLSKLDDLDEDRLSGFEKGSAIRLRRFCEKWKDRKS